MPVIYYKDKMYASGGGCQSYGGQDAPIASIGTDGDYYYQYDATGDVQITYVRLSGAWHKIAGGDVIIIEGGDVTSDNYGKYAMIGNHNIGMEVEFNAE